MEIVQSLRNLDVKGKKPLGNQKYNDFSNGRFLSILHNNVAPCEFPAVPTIFALR